MAGSTTRSTRSSTRSRPRWVSCLASWDPKIVTWAMLDGDDDDEARRPDGHQRAAEQRHRCGFAERDEIGVATDGVVGRGAFLSEHRITLTSRERK